jgi:hypothetical protein
VARSESEQPWCGICHVVKHPMLECVVSTGTHEQRLTREEVQAHLCVHMCTCIRVYMHVCLRAYVQGLTRE